MDILPRMAIVKYIKNMVGTVKIVDETLKMSRCITVLNIDLIGCQCAKSGYFNWSWLEYSIY